MLRQVPCLAHTHMPCLHCTAAGVQTALAFAKPYECERLLTAAPQAAGSSPRPSSRLAGRRRSSSSSGSGDGSPSSTESSSPSSDGLCSRVRSWAAQEQWLTPQEFSELLHSPPYDVLLGCDTWRACSEMVSTAAAYTARCLLVLRGLLADVTACLCSYRYLMLATCFALCVASYRSDV
jgi:hypothetical protein